MPAPSHVTIAHALREAETQLSAEGIDAPRVQAMALLESVLDLDRAAVLARLRDPILAESLLRFRELVVRRSANEPLQYLLGRAHFLDYDLEVGPGVFIPRPETEQLVETAVRTWSPSDPWALDLCCGSGAVAIGLARARRDARVLAVDLAPAPRSTTRRNTIALDVSERVTVLGSDLLTALAPRGAGWPGLGAIVCNPPYAAEGEVVQPEVLNHEPLSAILAGDSGTAIYATVIPAAAELLAPGRPLLFELGYGREGAVRELLDRDGRWSNITVDPDFQDIPRVLTAWRADETGAPSSN